MLLAVRMNIADTFAYGSVQMARVALESMSERLTIGNQTFELVYAGERRFDHCDHCAFGTLAKMRGGIDCPIEGERLRCCVDSSQYSWRRVDD